MTDREAAAGLVELLTSRIGENFDGECHLTEEEARAGIRAITTLLSELERVGKERDAYCDDLHAETVNRGAAEARALKAEKERDEANLEINRYRAEVDDLNSECDRLDLEKGTAEALVAEAVRVCEPFAERSDRLHSGYDAGIAAGDDPFAYVVVRHLRAARAC